MASKSRAKSKEKARDSIKPAQPDLHTISEDHPADPADLLIQQLHDPDVIVRSTAAGSLGHTRSEKAIEPLIEALRDPHVYVRHGAAWALGEIRSDKAVVALRQALNDDDEITRAKAAEALGKIQGS